jgi:hypothetical protein
MRRIVWLLLALPLCSGCATHYNITLDNGEVITARGKPKYDAARSGYFFTDATGNPSYISQLRVHEIAPQSWKKKNDAGDFKFLPSPAGQ